MNQLGEQVKDGPEGRESPWRERLRALKNMPPVLGILWDSGPGVVTAGLVLRVIVAVLPFGIAKVAQYIIQDIAARVMSHAVLPKNFWMLVGTEVGLNVLLGLMTRAIDYSDALLANRYTQYVSVRVMDQAARLDLTTYENPIFYDRLERARVQATDRLAMIQQMGRLFQQTITTLVFSAALAWASPWLVLCWRGRAAVVCGRDALRVPGLCEELPPDAGQAAYGLSAAGGGQPRGRQGGEALRAERVLHQSLPGAGDQIYARMWRCPVEADLWAGCWGSSAHWGITARMSGRSGGRWAGAMTLASSPF